MKPFAFLPVLLCGVSLPGAVRPAESQMIEMPRWQQHFDSAGVTGALLLYEPKLQRYRASNLQRVRSRVVPASTFKIFSTLAAVEARVISGPDEVIRWDGQDRCIAGWNRDLSVRKAFQESAFWVYQRLVHYVGPERMRHWLRQAEYGNQDSGGGIDRFWLDGSLRISMLEQVEFLQRLHTGRLPFSARAIAAVQDVMVEERGADYVLRGKTGWARQLTAAGDRFADCRPAADQALGPPVTPELGWYVGTWCVASGLSSLR